MLRDFRISELRAMLNSVTLLILCKNLRKKIVFLKLALVITFFQSFPKIHDHMCEWAKICFEIESFAFLDNSRFMTTK